MAIRRYVELINGHAKPFIWTKTAPFRPLTTALDSVIGSLTRALITFRCELDRARPLFLRAARSVLGPSA
jgi:hypothetical protein